MHRDTFLDEPGAGWAESETSRMSIRPLVSSRWTLRRAGSLEIFLKRVNGPAIEEA